MIKHWIKILESLHVMIFMIFMIQMIRMIRIRWQRACHLDIPSHIPNEIKWHFNIIHRTTLSLLPRLKGAEHGKGLCRRVGPERTERMLPLVETLKHLLILLGFPVQIRPNSSKFFQILPNSGRSKWSALVRLLRGRSGEGSTLRHPPAFGQTHIIQDGQLHVLGEETNRLVQTGPDWSCSYVLICFDYLKYIEIWEISWNMLKWLNGTILDVSEDRYRFLRCVVFLFRFFLPNSIWRLHVCATYVGFRWGRDTDVRLRLPMETKALFKVPFWCFKSFKIWETCQVLFQSKLQKASVGF